jgi:hypothetical protein
MGIEMPPEWMDPAQNEPQHFEVWPENWEAVRLFIRCQTQWRVSDGRRIGLDYGAMLAIGSLFSVENLSQVVESVQVIEAEILTQGAKR